MAVVYLGHTDASERIDSSFTLDAPFLQGLDINIQALIQTDGGERILSNGVSRVIHEYR